MRLSAIVCMIGFALVYLGLGVFAAIALNDMEAVRDRMLPFAWGGLGAALLGSLMALFGACKS